MARLIDLRVDAEAVACLSIYVGGEDAVLECAVRINGLILIMDRIMYRNPRPILNLSDAPNGDYFGANVLRKASILPYLILMAYREEG